jgi:hypothetical protein
VLGKLVGMVGIALVGSKVYMMGTPVRSVVLDCMDYILVRKEHRMDRMERKKGHMGYMMDHMGCMMDHRMDRMEHKKGHRDRMMGRMGRYRKNYTNSSRMDR